MKKTLLIIIAFLSCYSLFSQEKGHYITIGARAGASKLLYDMPDDIRHEGGTINPRLGMGANIGYSYFFTKNWGLGTGVGISYYNNAGKYNTYFQKFEDLLDDQGDLHAKDVYLQNWSERQQIMFLEVPLLVQFQHKFNDYIGFYANAGAKAMIPVSATYKVENGNLRDIQGNYGQWGGVIMTDMQNHGYYKDKNKPSGDMNIKTGFAATAQMGILLEVTRKLDFFIGAYLDYGFTDINKETKHPDILAKNQNNQIVYNSVMRNEVVNPMSLGVEAGIKFKLGESCRECVKDKKKNQEIEKQTQIIENQKPNKDIQDLIEALKNNNQKPQSDPELNKNLKRIGDMLEKAMQMDNAKKVKGDNGQDAVKLEFDADVLFKTAQSTLNENAKETLNKLANLLTENSQASIDIFGHTDNVGSLEYNQKLSVDRANSVATYLKSQGVKENQIRKRVGRNFSEPKEDNSTPQGRQKNRRVEVIIYSNR